MAISVLFNGVVYAIPETGEESWGEDLTSYFTAIPQGALQKSGGTFTLTADVNFGANYGLLSKYYTTRTSNAATAGQFRLARADVISWRNQANAANLDLAVDSSNRLTFNSVVIQGAITIGALDAAAANATGLALTGTVLSTQSADATHPGMVNTSAQTLGSGVKTFSSAPIMSALTASQVVVTDSGKALASLAYASANTASALVQRDGSGNFSAGTITASLTGTASGNTTYTANQYGVVLSGSGNAMSVRAPDASTAKVFVSGGASANPSWALITNTNLSGSAAISNANLASMASSSSTVGTVKGNISGSSTTPSDIVLSSAATASSVVYRDSSGNFAATTITAALTGTASGNLTYSANQYGALFSGSGNTVSVLAPDASTAKVLISGGASANPAWGLLTNTNLSGSAAITNANLATMVTATAKANISGSTGTPSDVSLVAAATASTIMLRDTSANVRINALIENFATTATAAGTTTLTVSSAEVQQFTGSTTQNCVLPDATTLVIGQRFTVLNRSSGTVTVKDSAAGTVQAMATSSQGIYTVTNISSAAGVWDAAYTNVGSGSSPGTVTSVALTVPTALFATSPVTGSPITTAGTLAPTLATQTARTFFQGPLGGSAATPTFAALTAPTVQKFTSSTGTYTTPTSPAPLYIRVRMVGGGGGGGGGSTGNNTGGNGTASTFGTTLLSAGGGTGAVTNTQVGGAGGTSSLGSGPIGTALTGGYGGGGSFGAETVCGGMGGSSGFFGSGGPSGGGNNTAPNALANSGAGGGGGGSGGANQYSGAGGGAGGYIDAIIASPSATYSYTVGAGGSGGVGTATTGGAGGSGYIEVTEYYQ